MLTNGGRRVGGAFRRSLLSPPQLMHYSPRQRRINLKTKNPYDVFEEYIKEKENLPTMREMGSNLLPGRPVIVAEQLAKQQIEEYRQRRAEGRVPLEKAIQEEPSIKDFVDKIKFQEQLRDQNWKPGIMRPVVLGVKVGMMHYWDHYGRQVPVTVVHVPRCVVTNIRKIPHSPRFEPQDPFAHTHLTHVQQPLYGVQVSSGHRHESKVSKPLLGHFRSVPFEWGDQYPMASTETKVHEGALPELGTQLTCQHFVPGQFIDVKGVTTGKGFQGPMKRWGFGGQSKTHGTHKDHRKHGATGAQGIKKTWKGKKMAGRMGNENRTQLNCWVFAVDPDQDTIFIKGSIPAHTGKFVILRDAHRRTLNQEWSLPTPTYTDEYTYPDNVVKEHDMWMHTGYPKNYMRNSSEIVQQMQKQRK